MELSNCPFCAKEAVWEEVTHDFAPKDFRCGCQTLGCRGYIGNSPAYSNVVAMHERWNRREGK